MGTHYYAELLNYFSRTLQDRDAAADVVQESYARVLGLHARELVRDMRALLFQTGRNLVIDEARRRKVEASMLDTLALVAAGSAPAADQVAQAREQLDRLAARLATLPPRRRAAFILVRVYGMTHAEAAQHQAVSVEAIEKHVVRAVCDLMDLATRLRC